MEKTVCCLLLFLFSLLLCQVHNIAAHKHRKDDVDISRQIELLRLSNEKLTLKIEMLYARYNQKNEECSNLINKLDWYLSHAKDNCATNRKYPSNCAEATKTKRVNGIYSIQVDSFGDKPFLASCDVNVDGGGWTVIQRRQDGSVDFYRDWAEYKTGFGNLEGEFFIGLDKLHALTTEQPQELLIVLSDFEGVTKYAKYDAFAIGDESEAYALKVLGKYSGDAKDSFTYHAGQKFTTKDRDNDVYGNNCALEFKGAWWYKACHASNLNGLYLKGKYTNYAQGIDWDDWHGHYYSLKYVQMMIRPKRN